MSLVYRLRWLTEIPDQGDGIGEDDCDSIRIGTIRESPLENREDGEDSMESRDRKGGLSDRGAGETNDVDDDDETNSVPGGDSDPEGETVDPAQDLDTKYDNTEQVRPLCIVLTRLVTGSSRCTI